MISAHVASHQLDELVHWLSCPNSLEKRFASMWARDLNCPLRTCAWNLLVTKTLTKRNNLKRFFRKWFCSLRSPSGTLLHLNVFFPRTQDNVVATSPPATLVLFKKPQYNQFQNDRKNFANISSMNLNIPNTHVIKYKRMYWFETGSYAFHVD